MRRTEGKAPLRSASAAFIVSFLICGLWHSITWPYFAWGSFQAFGLIVCNYYRFFLIKRLGRKGYNRYLANPWFAPRRLRSPLSFPRPPWRLPCIRTRRSHGGPRPT